MCYNRGPNRKGRMSFLLPLAPSGNVTGGPQRIVLHADGEHIRWVEYHAGLHARGCAERLLRIPLKQCYPLVNRVCGVHSHHHSWAWTMALESLAGIEVPPRAEVLRGLVAETERMASHLHSAAAIVAALGLDVLYRHLFELRELSLEAAKTLTGQRLLHDFLRPGGVEHDLHVDERAVLQGQLNTIGDDAQRIVGRLLRARSLRRRTARLAALSSEQLDVLGVRGWLARASGIDQDLRRDQPYGIYEAGHPAVVLHDGGDVYARILTLLAETYESVDFCRRLLVDLPGGRWRGDLLDAVPAGETIQVVEAPSGLMGYRLVSDGQRLVEVEIELAVPPQALLARALPRSLIDDALLVTSSLALCAACSEA